MAHSGYSDDEKQLCVQRAIKGEPYRNLVAEYGVSDRTITTWRRKWEHLFVDENPEYTGASRLRSWRDEDGNYQAEWTKYSKEIEETKQALQAFADGIKDTLPRAKPIPPPEHSDKELMTAYILTDAHIGMKSEDWDLDIAERVIKGWINYVTKRTPDASQGVFIMQGDIAHWDSMTQETPANKHNLEGDGNSRSMVRTIIDITRYCVDILLQKHENVHIIYAVGNHDSYTATITSEWLAAFYENEPRITVDTGNTLYHAFEWGDVSIFSHHGHKRNISNISTVFAGMYRDLFGRTKYSYGHIGHFHHAKRKPMGDDGLMNVEIHPTLSGKDDYALHGGWLSDRGAQAIVYHKRYGEVDRARGVPDMFT